MDNLRDMVAILERDAWACVDSSLNDIPVCAWTNFQQHRSGLHTPVPCTLYTYHAHADIILDQVLHAIDTYLRTL